MPCACVSLYLSIRHFVQKRKRMRAGKSWHSTNTLHENSSKKQPWTHNRDFYIKRAQAHVNITSGEPIPACFSKNALMTGNKFLERHFCFFPGWMRPEGRTGTHRCIYWAYNRNLTALRPNHNSSKYRTSISQYCTNGRLALLPYGLKAGAETPPQRVN